MTVGSFELLMVSFFTRSNVTLTHHVRDAPLSTVNSRFSCSQPDQDATTFSRVAVLGGRKNVSHACTYRLSCGMKPLSTLIKPFFQKLYKMWVFPHFYVVSRPTPDQPIGRIFPVDLHVFLQCRLKCPLPPKHVDVSCSTSLPLCPCGGI